MPYFENVPSQNGLNKLPSNPCKLLDLQLLVLNDGETFQGTSGEREICAVLLGGKATFVVNDKTFASIGGRANVFAGKPYSVYIPCQVQYAITAIGRVEIALASAPSTLATEPYVIAPEHVVTLNLGAANFSRTLCQILTLAGQPNLPAQRLIVGETFTPSGNWSTFPPHRHEKEDLPREAFHEEMYLFKVTPADGFGVTRHYDETNEASYTVRDNTILMVPHGYHTVASAPGSTTYYLWFLAGNHRVQAVAEDPNFAWASRAVPMLKALGH